MKIGTKIKYINPLNEEEKTLVMTVIEDRDTRLLVTEKDSTLAFPPTWNCRKTEVATVK